jgi:hypothetical protein
MSQHDAPLDEARLAASPLDTLDDRILRQVAELYDRVDPVPADLADRIKFQITWGALEAELAQMEIMEAERVGARTDDATAVRTITFSTATVTTMVTMTPTTTDRVRIDGWIAPCGALTVELRIGSEVRQTVADSDGRFVFDDVPHGPGQFLLRSPGPDDQRPIITPTIDI